MANLDEKCVFLMENYRLLTMLMCSGDGRLDFDEFYTIFSGDQPQHLFDAEKKAFLDEAQQLSEEVARLNTENEELTQALNRKVIQFEMKHCLTSLYRWQTSTRSST